MMMGNFKGMLLGLTVAAVPVTAEAATIDFDVDGFGAAIIGNTAITNQYANLGVLFEGFEDGSSIGINAAPDPDGDPQPSSPNSLTNCFDASTFCPGNRADIVRITFASAVSQIGLSLNSLGSSAVTFNLYDAMNILLETQSLSSASGTYLPVSFLASGVSRIDALQPTDSWAWAMDDLSYSVATVPVPATLGLLVTALLGFGAFGRRKSA